MNTVNIDGLVLTQQIVDELHNWYRTENHPMPEDFLSYIETANKTLIHVLCEDESDRFTSRIKESLSGLMMISESLTKFIPEI